MDDSASVRQVGCAEWLTARGLGALVPLLVERGGLHCCDLSQLTSPELDEAGGSVRPVPSLCPP
jgi:hypothetical protein